VETSRSWVGNALPGVPDHDNETGHAGTGTSVMLVPLASSATVSAATSLQQKRKRQMSTQFQTGYVRLVGKKWYGRHRRDIAGQEERKQPLVVLGSKSEMNKQQARKKLLDIIEKEGLNNPNFLEKLTVPALTFNAVADAWELKRLPQLKESTQYTAPNSHQEISASLLWRDAAGSNQDRHRQRLDCRLDEAGQASQDRTQSLEAIQGCDELARSTER
jgi:hypothetical protein